MIQVERFAPEPCFYLFTNKQYIIRNVQMCFLIYSSQKRTRTLNCVAGDVASSETYVFTYILKMAAVRFA